jgi:hypothetical protein
LTTLLSCVIGTLALGVDQLDSLRHRIFPAVLHGLEAQAGAV